MISSVKRTNRFIGDAVTSRDHYIKVKSRRGTKDARCSTARKIAEITYTVWSEQRCWEEIRS